MSSAIRGRHCVGVRGGGEIRHKSDSTFELPRVCSAEGKI